MELIDKSAVVAEIDDWQDKITKGIFTIPLKSRQRADASLEYEILEKVRDFIDTLDVKEVNMEEEMSKYLGDDWKKDADGKIESEMIAFAKHFFELGLKLRKD